jgi:hypothetical protein
MKRFRRVPSRSLAVAITALFVALGGTGYAAFSLPKNSVGTKQLKSRAVTGPKIAAGSVTGSKIANGTITGANVNLLTLGTVPSASNANHANSADTATNAGHAQTADTAPLPTTLPTGATLTGVYALHGQVDTGTCPNCSDSQADAISFPIPLATAPIVHVIALGDPVPAGCSGTPGNPGASSGNLCIFEGWNFNATGLGVCAPPGTIACTGGGTRFGVGVVAFAAGNGVWDDFGTWAVTG